MAEYGPLYPEESVSTVAVTITAESKKEVTVVQEEQMKLPMQIFLQPRITQSVRERDDDWFLLLDVVSRETSYVAPGTHSL